MIDYKNNKIAEAIPEAASMIETFRAIGYSLETAVADIIDNSIAAGASYVQIERKWNGSKSCIIIRDDGSGMTNEELINAMRPGAKSPLQVRDKKDLGRFGLGLKTASFSQCRTLSVISKKDDIVSFWTWDLDYIAECNKWNLIHWIPNEFDNAFDDIKSGTIVIWSNLDRVIPVNTSKDDVSAKERFSSRLQNVCNFLAMTFHRFIEDQELSIIWGSHEIKPWNPFCPNETKRQPFPVEYLAGNVVMNGFVLPHKSNFSSDLSYSEAEGPKGWNGQQGFYVYRGKRLLLSGVWLGLFHKEESCKLARIAIDLPNDQDAEWQIDIKKSKAFPPMYCKDQIEQYAKSVRNAAEEVFRHRGKILRQRAGREFQPLWLEKNKDSHWTYVINRKSPLINQLKEMALSEPELAIETLLKLIESNVPTKTIFINEARDEDSVQSNYSIDIETIKSLSKRLLNDYINKGYSSAQAKSALKLIAPFNLYEDIIEGL